MIYQIFYDFNSRRHIQAVPGLVKPCGVYKACQLEHHPDYVYDDEKTPNLTEHNSLCEWRALYYIWRHYPSKWVGFTSWRHDQKGFMPAIANLKKSEIISILNRVPIAGFVVRPLADLMIRNFSESSAMTLRSQFLQWSLVETALDTPMNDQRRLPLGKYHSSQYWDFVIGRYQSYFGINLDKDLDWEALGKIRSLHTWCNAFVCHWEYFDKYMTAFSPIVLDMLDHFGSHPEELELSYICERLIIIHNYIQYSNDQFYVQDSEAAFPSEYGNIN
jgi:hypothetical protein